MKKILVTGGAGFIGSALVRGLASRGGYEITVLDNLSPQIHGSDATFAADLRPAAVCVRGDVRDPQVWEELLPGQELIVHLAAETGTGQSMYEIGRYTSVNVGGTAAMLEGCDSRGKKVERIVLASSRAIYGEGKYRCSQCGVVYPGSRKIDAMDVGDFEPHCPQCGEEVAPLATDEETPIRPASVYGVTKACQEQLVTVWGESRGIKTVALRFQNVYGPGQALGNPYTGILSIFSNRILAELPLDIYEDGRESRDFVFIDDVVRAMMLTIEAGVVPSRAYNVGAGQPVTVAEVASLLMEVHGSSVPAPVTGHFRAGDIRHNFADMARFRTELGFQTQWSLRAGLERLIHWVREAGGDTPDLATAQDELESKGLLRTGRVGGHE